MLGTTVRHRRSQTPLPDSEEDWQQRLQRAQILVSKGELSHASRLIRSNGMAEGNDATLNQLRDVNLRPPQRLREISPEVMNYRSDEDVQLDFDRFVANLRSSRRGLSGGLSGHRNEHLKCCLDDEGALTDLFEIGQISE